jgi:hypothetical protein
MASLLAMSALGGFPLWPAQPHTEPETGNKKIFSIGQERELIVRLKAILVQPGWIPKAF